MTRSTQPEAVAGLRLEIVDVPMPNLGSSPRADLRDLPIAQKNKPVERGEKTFQQFDGTDLCAWHVRSAVAWRSTGPVFRLTQDTTQPEAVAGLRHGKLEGQDLSALTPHTSIVLDHVTKTLTRFIEASEDGILTLSHSLSSDAYFYTRPDQATYVGEEYGDDWIAAPLGGWSENPVPGRRVDVRSRMGAITANILSGDTRWSDRGLAVDYVAFRLTDANPQQEASAIPAGVSWSPEHENFYDDATGRGKGEGFWHQWHTQHERFPVRQSSATQQEGASLPGGEGFAALNTGFATTISEGDPDPSKRKAFIKIAFDGEDSLARARTAFGYLDGLVSADRAAPPTLKSGDREAIEKAIARGRDQEWRDWEIADAILPLLRPAGDYEGLEVLRRAIDQMFVNRSKTYTNARGKVSSLEADGEACWIVSHADMEDLEIALRQLTAPDASMKEGE